MFKRTRKADKWAFETLADYAAALQWLDEMRVKGETGQATIEYLRHATPLLRESIDKYEEHLLELDNLTGGILAKQPADRRNPEGMSLTEKLQSVAKELRSYFDHLLNASGPKFVGRWAKVLGHSNEYMQLLGRLVTDFGNFETLLPTLPGTGPIISDPQVQNHLMVMYRLNTRNLRMLELIFAVYRSWNKDLSKRSLAFFDPQYELSRGVANMILEYMVEADPQRVSERRDQAYRAGRRHNPYRFWRAAENVRLMAEVDYIDGDKRRPYPRRKYVEMHLEPVPPVCVDHLRLGWAMKEIFNNSLPACSVMYDEGNGKWRAEPLDRHNVPNPDAAIRFNVETILTKRWFRKPLKTVRMTVVDEGVGIAPEHIDKVAYWGYSPRREAFRAKARETSQSGEDLNREIQIGGKGIGLAYASEIFREHGGKLVVEHNPEGGTIVTCELPVPTSVELES